MPCVALDVISEGQGTVGAGGVRHPLGESGKHEIPEEIPWSGMPVGVWRDEEREGVGCPLD